MLTPQEATYRSTVNRIAFAMLMLYGFFLIYSGSMIVLEWVIESMPVVAGDVLYEVLYGLFYAVTFLLPVPLFYWISKHKKPRPIVTDFILPRETIWYIFASLAIISAAGYLNSFLLEPFTYNTFFEEYVSYTAATSNYQLILQVFTIAVVPAFVEELLFRGVVLENLLPYGRTTAVLISALLFGLMHQNAGQLLYATVAGLVFGYIYVHTKSIWCCVLIHFCNNFISVIQSAMSERMPAAAAVSLSYLLETLVFVLGIIGAVRLICSQKDRAKVMLQGGAFEKELSPDSDYAEIDLSLSRRIRLFFSPAMIVYIVLCILNIFSLLGLALLV